MTPTPNIDSLSDRVLDAAVAEALFGWTDIERRNEFVYVGRPPKPHDKLNYVPRFHDDWSAAALVVERMREMGWEFRCHGPQELYSYWEAFFTMPGDEWPIREVEAKGDTFPTAVCRAALKAREAKHK